MAAHTEDSLIPGSLWLLRDVCARERRAAQDTAEATAGDWHAEGCAATDWDREKPTERITQDPGSFAVTEQLQLDM